MKTVLVLAVITLLSGCGAIPSMKYCDEVTYTRKGAQVHIEARCQASVGGVGL